MNEETFLKIAVTADLHLTTRQNHPERFEALENILDQIIERRIDTLIIAGDLFDETSRNYVDFETVCKAPRYRHIRFHVLPGNHDALVDGSMFSAENVSVYSEPAVYQFDLMSLPFLFLPFKPGKTMGELVAPFNAELDPLKWMLMGHGDWIEGMREVNPLEPGTYMPLTRTDLDSFRPVSVILGHIHKPMDKSLLHYTGSPCPLDINETGRRRFLIVDTDNGIVTSQVVDSANIYFNESFVVLPVEEEQAFLISQIESRIKSWDLKEDEIPRVQIRIKVLGYTRDKRAVAETLKKQLNRYFYYKGEDPNLEALSTSADLERAEIAQRVRNRIHDLDWPLKEDESTKDHILLEALRVIYGE